MLLELDLPHRAGSIGCGAPSVLIGSWVPSRDVVAPRLVCLLHSADARYALWWPLGLRFELDGKLQTAAARIADSTPVARGKRSRAPQGLWAACLGCPHVASINILSFAG